MRPAEFTVGWICALPLELTAAQGMLDEKYEDSDIVQNPHDTNTYTLGQIAGHKVVLTLLISAGTNHASSTAIHMQYTFQGLRFILMVGIGGGIPKSSGGNDVRLGDVVVSMPSGAYGGVIQFDSGKLLQGKDFLRTGALKAPPPYLQKVVKTLIATHESEENCITKYIEDMLEKHFRNTRTGTEYRRPDRGNDLLFEANYVCKRDGQDGLMCAHCDTKQLIIRHDRPEDKPVIHYGTIASGSSVMRDALKRDQLGKDCGALCVEMEAAGLMDELDCLVIRGICDYADSHKNKQWQRYAAAAAAAYAKELLSAVNHKASHTRSSTEVGTVNSMRRFSSPKGHATQSAGPSRTSSTEPTWTPPPPKACDSPRLPPLPALQTAQHPPRRYTFDQQYSPQIPSHSTKQSTSPPSFPLPQPQRFNTDESLTSDSVSKAPSPSVLESVWERREGEETLTEFWAERCLFAGFRNQDANDMGQCDFRIFELRKGVDSLPTRRIAIRSCENGEHCISSWMPLDSVHVGIEHRQVTISWSDCSHIHEATKGYRTTFTCRYIPVERNRRVVFESKDVSATQEIAEVLLYPTLEYLHYDSSLVPTGSSFIDTLRVYKRRTARESALSRADEHTDFAILVSSDSTRSTRHSRLYMGRPCLDFRLNEAHNLLTFKEMRSLTYLSSLEKPSENAILRHLNPEGGPDREDWKIEDLELSPINHKGLIVENLMTALTGWKLLFSEDASSVVVQGRTRLSQKNKIKGALVMIWERENESGRDIQLLVRASEASREPESTTWLSTSLTSPRVHLTKPELTLIAMEVQACWRGPGVLIHQMTVDPRSASEPKKQNIRLQFVANDHANNFYIVSGQTNQSLRQATTVDGSARGRESLSSVPSRPMSNQL